MDFLSDALGWGPRTGEGPCEPECAKDCQLHQIGDRTCDRACFEESCEYDGGDCDVCAVGCPWSWVHDGQCDPECFVESCFFDSDDSDINGAVGDCRGDQACGVGCSPFMVGNGECDANCTSAACRFDGGDCGQFCDAPQVMDRLPLAPSVCPSVCLSVCLSVWLAGWLAVWLSCCLSVCLRVCVSVCVQSSKNRTVQWYQSTNDTHPTIPLW